MKIAVLGAGAAGMRAAMILETRGHEVQVYEARNRLGGRMQTATVNEESYEAGGEWIDADHERCQLLAHELGIPLVPGSEGERRFHYQSRSWTESTQPFEILQDELQFEAAARDYCRTLRKPPWASEHAATLDRSTLADFIAANSTTDLGRWAIEVNCLSDEGTELDRIGLLGWLAGYSNYLGREGWEMSALRFEGGAKRLFDALATKLKNPPLLGWHLISVKSDPLTLEFEHETVQSFDRVILTLPPRALERVIFDPPITVEKRCAVEAYEMSPIVKVALCFDRNWWSELGWNGEMQTDRLIQQTWPIGNKILMAYVCGKSARTLRESPDPVNAVLASLVELYPEAEDLFVTGVFHDWISDPFAGGGFSNTAPGYVTEFMPHIATPVGPIHFAGEHTSPYLGFIEGALESAERVANEMGT